MILITGAAGFIGNALAASFSGRDDVLITDVVEPRQAHGLRFVRADLCDAESCASLPDASVVFHLSAQNNTGQFYKQPLSVINNTLLPTINMVNRYGDRTLFIYAGSSELYAGLVNRGMASIPTPEVTDALIDGIGNPRWSYAGSKIMGEQIVHAAHVQHGMRYLILRYHNVYGPGQRGHFIPEYAARLIGGDDVLYGADQTRSFTYVDDAIRITRLLADAACNDTVNVGNPEELSVGEVASMIRDTLGVARPPVTMPAPTGSVGRRCPDVSRMHSYIGPFGFTSIRVGIERCLEGLHAR